MADNTARPDTHNDEAQAKRSGSPRMRQLKMIAIVVVAVLLVVWLAFWLYHRLTHVSENDARVASHVITVSSRLDGRVTGFDLIEGDRLNTHALIAQLYSKPDTLKLQQLKAQIDNIQTRLNLARQQISGGVDQTQSMLAADVSAMHAAKSRMDKAQDNYRRSDNLYKAHGGTQKQRDIDRFDYQSAQAEYARAQSRVKTDKVAIANARTGLLPGGQLTNPDVLESQLKVARAELAHQQNMIDDLAVTSPIDGVIDQTFIEQDEYVSAGQPIVMMHDPNDVWIEAKVKETKVNDLRVGQPVAISVDARPDIQYRGHVQVIGDAATNQFALLPDPNPSGNFTKITQRIPVRIAIDHGPRPRLAPGMMVEVDIDITDQGNTQANQQQRPIRTRSEQLAPPANASQQPALHMAQPDDQTQNKAAATSAADWPTTASRPRIASRGLQLAPPTQLD